MWYSNFFESAEQDARMPNNLGDAGRASLGIALRRIVQDLASCVFAPVPPNLRPYEFARRAAALRQLPMLNSYESHRGQQGLGSYPGVKGVGAVAKGSINIGGLGTLGCIPGSSQVQGCLSTGARADQLGCAGAESSSSFDDSKRMRMPAERSVVVQIIFKVFRSRTFSRVQPRE